MSKIIEAIENEQINKEVPKFSPGDTVMLMSDGFPELFNEAREMLGYEQAVTVFEEVAHRSPEEIIAHFTKTAADWMNRCPQDDDVTFIVMKMKPPRRQGRRD